MGSGFDDTRLLNYTDAELIGYIASLPSLSNFPNIIPPSPKYLANGYAEDELLRARRHAQLHSPSSRCGDGTYAHGLHAGFTIGNSSGWKR